MRVSRYSLDTELITTNKIKNLLIDTKKKLFSFHASKSQVETLAHVSDVPLNRDCLPSSTLFLSHRSRYRHLSNFPRQPNIVANMCHVKLAF